MARGRLARGQLAVALTLTMVAVACGGPDGTAPSVATDPTSPAAPASPGGPTGADGSTVTVAETEVGEVLVDGQGMALYLFEPDEAGPSTCTGDCAAAWPPLPAPAMADGVDASLLGEVEREDGTLQVTYAGWPLYHFSGDRAPGDLNGQGLQEVWWLVDAEGRAVTATAEANEEEDDRYDY